MGMILYNKENNIWEGEAINDLYKSQVTIQQNNEKIQHTPRTIPLGGKKRPVTILGPTGPSYTILVCPQRDSLLEEGTGGHLVRTIRHSGTNQKSNPRKGSPPTPVPTLTPLQRNRGNPRQTDGPIY